MTTKSVALLVAVSVVVSLAVGYRAGSSASAPKPPPAPRTPAEVARSEEVLGEIRGILAERDVLARAALLSNRLLEYGPEDVPTVADLLRQGTAGLGQPEAALLARFWAQHAPAEATEWAFRTATPWEVRPMLLSTAVEAWAVADPERALAGTAGYMNDAPDEMRESMRAALIRGWYLSGEPGAVEYLRGLEGSIDLDPSMRALVNEMLNDQGLDVVLEWLDEFPTEEDFRFKRAAAWAVAPAMARIDLDRAIAWCEEYCDRPWASLTRSRVAVGLAADRGTMAAFEWLAEAPAGGERDRALYDVFDPWVRADPEVAKAWIASQDPATAEPWVRDLAGRIAVIVSFEDPLLAYEWAAVMPPTSADRQELTMVDITRRYAEIDPDAARAWLETSPLSEEMREKARVFPKNWHMRDGQTVLYNPRAW